MIIILPSLLTTIYVSFKTPTGTCVQCLDCMDVTLELEGFFNILASEPFYDNDSNCAVYPFDSDKIEMDADVTVHSTDLTNIYRTELNEYIQLWEVELLFLVYYVSNYILKYFATSNADDKFQQIISSWRLFMNYSLTQEGQKYDFDRIRPQSTIQSRYLIFQKGKIEITTCNKRTAMTKINAVEDVQGRSTNSLNKLRQF
ncbi:Hypothetical_protein [Hexamita inflata]|uniref:Hypothetical_protein n=1 Tax=Hexamita inflata TaxID=28002 RepID=A0AA86TKV8_9EUKA|nr:Hypothetical protein HINF_LOCUS3588 [Hexamita inflata]